MGALATDANTIAARFRSGLESDLVLGRLALVELFRGAGGGGRGPAGAPPAAPAASSAVDVADSATHAMVANRILEAMFVTGRELRTVEQKLNLSSAPPTFRLPPLSNAAVTVFDLVNIPTVTTEQWRSRVGFIRRDEFRPEDPSEDRQIVSIANVLRAGPLVSLRIGWSVFSNAPGGGRRGGGGSTTLYLLEVDGEWVVVHGITGVA